MSQHKKPEVQSRQWNLDEGIGDEYLLKSIENPIHDMKANIGDQKIPFFTFVESNRSSYDISSYMHGNDQTIVLDAQEIDQSTEPEHNENTHHMTSGDCYNKYNILVDHEQDDGVVSGDDVNDKIADDHEQDDGIVSGDNGNNKVTDYQKHDDGVVSGDDGNKTIAEDHDNENTLFVSDEEDMGFSFKNLLCIRDKAKIKDKNPYQTLTSEKEKKSPVDPFRQTQSKLLKKTNELGIFSHPPLDTVEVGGVHNSGNIGASKETSMHPGKTNYGITHTGNVHFENLGGREHIVNNRHAAHIGIDPDQYNFSHPKRGYAVLIVNKNFSRLDARNGAEVDVQNTTMVLQTLGFVIKNEKLIDLDKQSALKVLRDAKYADHSKMDSFAFIISSHGNEIENPRNGKREHAIYCSDDQYIFTNDILEMFSDENCPSLRGKPKLFFIQACRGNNADSGVEIMTVDGRNQNHSGVHNSSFHDGRMLHRVPHEPVMKAESNPQPCRVQIVDDMDANGFEDMSDERSLVHCNNDCLVMYAIPSGYFAWRSNMDGSWMLHYLWEEVKNYNFRKPCSFLKVLTAVNRKMANRETNVPRNIEKCGKKAIPVIIHQLDKDIVFQEKKPRDDEHTKAHVI